MTDDITPQSAASPRARKRARQCNADYRWTVPKVAAFLLALEKCGRVAEAAREVGMSRQAAYALRARLDGAEFREAFEGARRKGLRARAAASRARMDAARSRWEGPGLAALDYLRRGHEQADRSVGKTDISSLQTDRRAAQDDTVRRQDDAPPP